MLRCEATYTTTKEPPTWIPELKLTIHHREILATPVAVVKARGEADTTT